MNYKVKTCLSLRRAISAAALFLSAVSGALALPSYQARIDVSGYAGAALENFPVLVRISPERIRGFEYDACAPDGSDISFASDDTGTVIYPYEIDTWNPEGESTVWVKLPRLESGASFYFRWSDELPDSNTAAETWNFNYGGVWHLGEESGTCANSTSNGSVMDAEPKGNTANSLRYTGEDAPVGFARTTATSAARGYLSVPNYNNLNYGNVFTISGWVRFDACSGYPRLFSRKNSYTDNEGWEIEMASGSYTSFSARGRNNVAISGTIPTLNKSWVHVALVYNNTSLTVYANGAVAKTGTISDATDNAKPLSFGCDSNGDESYVQGQFDECRLMGIAASAEWIKAEYDSMASADFLAYGEAEMLADESELVVGRPSLTGKTANSASFSVSLASLGADASSADVYLVWGITSDSLVTTQSIATAVTASGKFSASLSRLYPNRRYFVKAVAINNLGVSAESAVTQFATDAPVNVAGLPGLWQTFFTSANANWTKDVSLLEEDPEGSWQNYTDGNRTKRRELGTLGAYLGGNPKATKIASEIWGDDVFWPVNGGQWVYWGYMHMEAGKIYKFRMRIDDNERVMVTDSGTGVSTVLLNDTANSANVITSSSFIPSVTGWHAIEVRMSDGTGDAGGYDATDSYKNTQNMGWSENDGGTWNLMLDPGDGSLFRTKKESPVAVTEIVAGGVLTGIKLDFPAFRSTTPLYIAYGAESGGSDSAAWDHFTRVTDLAAGATSYTCAVPAGWGEDDDCLVIAFRLGDSTPLWTRSIYWRDYSAPGLGDIMLDATGGDALRVKGTVTAFTGASCELKVLVGTSEDNLDRVWTGVAGSTLNAAGSYDLLLTVADTEDAKYFAPGETYYVCVEAISDGKVTLSEVAKATMSRAAAFGQTSAAVNRRTVTFTSQLTDTGMGAASEVSLWVGTSNNEAQLEKVEAPVSVDSRAVFAITHTFDNFETTYYWQLRANNTSASGTAESETRTAVASVKTLDTTTYTWTGNGAEGDWTDPANWDDGQSGNSVGYPGTAAATAIFPANAKATIVQRAPMTVGTFKATEGDIDLTFVQGGAGTNATRWTFSTFQVTGRNLRLKLDNTAFNVGGFTFGLGSSLILTNSANLNAGDVWPATNSRFELRDNSFMSVSQLGLGGDATSVISDSTLWTRSHDYVGRSYAGGKLRFEGTHPLWYHANADGYFKSDLDNANYRLEFVVPVGGYTVAPLSAISSQKYILGYNGNNKLDVAKRGIWVDIAEESPANRVDATITTPIVSWPNKGISKELLKLGNLPNDDGMGDDEFVWSAETDPLMLSVKIAGATHSGQIQVTGTPEEISLPGLVPANGYTSIPSGASQTCVAPEGIVQISDTKRASVKGWKVYTVDPATRERTLVDSGSGNSYTYTNSGDAWTCLEWQWKVEYKITAQSAGNGTAAALSDWVETGTKATVNVTPADGFAFAKWTGDVDPELNKESPLEFLVDGAPYTVTANFIPVIYVAPTGNDANDGSSWDSAKATIAGALASGGPAVVMLADGIYEVTAQIALNNGTVICGANPGAKAIVKCMAKISADTTAPSSTFKLAHEDAVLRNIAITTDFINGDGSKNAYGNAHNGDFARAVWIEQAGLVDSCVITNNRSLNCGGRGGGGVFLNKGGVVRNSILDRNITYASGGNNARGHHVVLVEGGLVENCVISRGGLVANPSSSAAVYFYRGGTVRNCLITGNSTGHTGINNATAVEIDGRGTIENCTISGNRHAASTASPAVYIWGGDNGAVIRNSIIRGNYNTLAENNVYCTSASYKAEYNCTTPALSGVGNIDADPCFADAENGDFHLGLSAVVDAARKLDWMGRLDDLDGNPRVSGPAPDMGCYEFSASGLSCGFDVETAGNIGTDSVTLKARVLGSNLSNLVYTWKLTDQNGNETVRSGADLAELTIPMGVGIYDVELTVSNGVDADGTAAKPAVFTVYPTEVYLAVDGANVFPYDSYANAATNFLDAVNASSDGTVIHVGPGWHRTAGTVALKKGIKVITRDGPENTFFFARSQTYGMPMLLIGNSDALVSGLTITGIDSNGARPEQWGGVLIASDGGTVTNSVICNNKTVNISIQGAGARMEGGTIVDTVFTNNFTRCSGGGGMRGGAIYMTGANALVDRCVIASNQVVYGATSYGGGVYMNAGTVRNSLIIGNYSINYGGGVAIEGKGKLINCTITGNNADSGNGGIWQNADSSSLVIADCLLYRNTVQGIALEDDSEDIFVDSLNGDFRLVPGTYAVDTGTSANAGDLDLDCKPRRSGSAIDLGCYELDQRAFTLGLSYEKLDAFAPCRYVFKAAATPEGTVLDEAQSWWTFDGTEPGPSNYGAAGLTVSTTLEPGVYTIRFKTVIGEETYSIEKSEWVTVYGQKVYLAMTGDSEPLFPYATPETAATNLSVAVSTVQAGGTIAVCKGEYTLDSVFNLNKPWGMAGETGDPRDVTFTTKRQIRLFTISNAKASLSGVRLTGTYVWDPSISIEAGVASNIIVEACTNMHGGYSVVAVANGLLVDSVITNCMNGYTTQAAPYSGGTLRINGANGLVDRVRITDSKWRKQYDSDTFTVNSGVVHFGEKGGTLRNSVIDNNAPFGCAVYASNVDNVNVENCTVTGNTTENPALGAGLYVEGNKAKVVNTVSWKNANDADFAGDSSVLDNCFIGGNPGIRMRGDEPFNLLMNSPLRRNGKVMDWMETAKDFYGRPRLTGKRQTVDIGAVECKSPAGSWLIFR